MQSYTYTIIDEKGARRSGSTEGVSKEEVWSQLKSQGHTPIQISVNTGGLMARLNHQVDFFQAINRRDIAQFTKQLADLINAGLSIDRSLLVLEDTTTRTPLKKVIGELRAQLRSGQSFGDALAQKSALFPTFYVSMVRAGEASGSLPESLVRLGSLLDRSVKFRSAIIGALIYPAILLFVVLLTLIVVVTLVLPQFAQVFNNSGYQLPWPTRVTMFVGEAAQSYWWVLGSIIVLATIALKRAWKRQNFRLWVHRALLNWRFSGFWAGIGDCVRYARMLGVLLSNGQSLAMAMRVANQGIMNEAIRQDLEDAAKAIREGEKFPTVVSRYSYLPSVFVQLCRVGDETGRLGSMLQQSADILEEQLEVRLQRFMASFAPVMTLILGGIVAALVGSLILGMMSVNNLAGI